MIILEIPRVPPSVNELMRYHYRVRMRCQKTWRDEVAVGLMQCPNLPLQPFEKARINICRQSRGQLDPDNLTGSVKPVLDALRYCRMIVNDTPDHIELTVTQSRGAPLTRIIVQPVYQSEE